MRAFAPTGSPIIGTSDLIPAVAAIEDGTFTVDEDGVIEFRYEGRSNIDWDGQTTKEVDGICLYMDDDGEEWPGSQIVIIDEETEAAWDEWVSVLNPWNAEVKS